MKAPIHMWFVQPANQDRRKPSNRLKRATMEAEQLEERMVNHWLELGKAALDGHDAARFRGKKKPAA